MAPMRPVRFLPPLALLLLLAQCSHPPAAVTVEGARELGPLPFAKAIRGRDGGYSARLGGRSVFVFGDTTLEVEADDGYRWRTSTRAWTADADASDGLTGFEEPMDSKSAPPEFLPLTPAEKLFNDTHFGPKAQPGCIPDCGARFALWPGAVVALPEGGALVFYTKLTARPGDFNFSGLGNSLASWKKPEEPPVRPEVRPGESEPTLLFPRGEPALGTAALLEGDELFAFACDCSGLSCPCSLARAKVKDALTRSAWRFLEDGRWTSDAGDADALFDGGAMMSVHRSALTGGFLALYSKPASAEVVLRTAPSLEGPWSEELHLFDAMPPDDPKAFPYAALAHPELVRDGGHKEYVTYFRGTGFLQGELRLVELTLR